MNKKGRFLKVLVVLLLPLGAYSQDDELARAKKELEERKARVAKLEELDRVRRDIEETKAHEARLEARLKQPTSDPQISAAPSETVSEAPKGKVINVEISWTYTQEQQSETPTLAAETKSKEPSGSGVRSFRPEFFTTIGEATSIGVDIELGHICDNGFYFSFDFGGGARYWGGGFNFGGTLNKDGNVKSVIGGTVGCWNAVIKVYERDNIFGREYVGTSGVNVSWSGVFCKMSFGGEKNFDVTNKVMFGFKEDVLDGWRGRFNTVWSLGVGYTLIKKRGK